MGNLSIYKPQKGKDYRFLDKLIRSQFDVGGTRIFIHKYAGPVSQGDSGDLTQNSTITTNESTIQDLLFLENRDRNYDADIIEIKASYTLSDIDFNLTQFGIMMSTNTLFLNFHINQMIDRLGRKIMPGDVLEIEHRKEDMVLSETTPYINAYYVVKDTARAADGYSPTWFAHIWRVRAEPLTDSPEYKQILNQIQNNGQTLKDLISNGNITDAINQIIQDQAAAEVPTRNFDSSNLYIETAGNRLPTNNLLSWPLNGDGIPPNQNDVAPSGRRFPDSPTIGDYFLRTDYNPPRLFIRETNKWCKVEDNWRDRPWSPASRTLEDHLENTSVTEISPNPIDIFLERQPIHNPIPKKPDLPQQE